MRLKAGNRLLVFAVAISVILLIAPTAEASQALKIKRGGAVVVSEGAGVTWTSLDPATNSLAALNANLMNPIFGQLIEQGPSGTYLPDLATSWGYADKGLEIVLNIRHGVTFQDGTPFNAQAVVANFTRVLEPQFACICDAGFADVTSITASGKYTVDLHLKAPNATIIESIVGEAPNWVSSPTALASEPETTFAQHPVGAGPFQVVSNSAGAQLVLSRFANYWNRPEPYLESLTFVPDAVDQSAIAAMQSGSVQVALNVRTVPLILAARSQFYVDITAGVSATGVRFNESKPPFNNILAREAIYYATNSAQITQALVPGFATVVEAPAGPGDAFYEKTVPGYRGYNLAKAQALVKQLGGLSFTFLGGTTAAAEELLAALQNQWQSAGMTVTLSPVATATENADVANGTWQMLTSSDGSLDPDVGIFGLENDFLPGGTLSGTNDPTLTGLVNKSEAFLNTATRQRTFDQIYNYIAKNAFSVMLYSQKNAAIISRSLTGAHIVDGASIFMNFETASYK